MLSLLLRSFVLLTGALSTAALACDLNGGPTGLAACDRVLEAGTMRLESFVNELSMQQGADRHLQISRNFYLSAAYFRLSLAERSQTLKCEYVDRALEALQNFRKALAGANLAEYKSFVMRHQVFGTELERQTQCALPGLPIAQFERLIDKVLSARLKDALSSPSWREATFAPVFREIAGVVQLTSTTLTKIETTKNSLENTKLELASEPIEGEVTRRVRLFTARLQDGTPTEIVSTKNEGFASDLASLNVETLLENKERLKVATHARADALLRYSTASEQFVKSVLEENSALKQTVEATQRAIPVLSQQSAESLNSLKKSSSMLRAVLTDACAPSSSSHTDYYCRYQ